MKVVTPRTSEMAMAALTGMFPFTQRAENSMKAATDSPARMANVLVLLLVPMRGVYGAGRVRSGLSDGGSLGLAELRDADDSEGRCAQENQDQQSQQRELVDGKLRDAP